MKLDRKNARNLLNIHGTRYFVHLSWINPSSEQRLAIGAHAMYMYIACNDTSVIVIPFRKSKTHAITDTYCTLVFVEMSPHGKYPYVIPLFKRRREAAGSCSTDVICSAALRWQFATSARLISGSEGDKCLALLKLKCQADDWWNWTLDGLGRKQRENKGKRGYRWMLNTPSRCYQSPKCCLK